MTVKSLLVMIGVDVAAYEAGMGKMKASLEKHQKIFTAIGGTMTAIGGVMTGFFAKSISEAAKSEAAQVALRRALSNVEGAAKGGAEMLIRYAGSLQQVTGIEDEEIENAMKILATMGLNEKQIAALTPRILDMAVAHSKATGEEINLTNAATSLGRAVNGHMDLLGRQGVILSENTKKTGDFNLLLKDLDKSFGGIAAASGQTFAGQMKILKVNIGETFEAIGGRLLPVLLPLVTRIGDVVKRVLNWMDAHQGLMKTLVPVLAGLGGLMTVLGPIVIILPKIATGAMMVGKTFIFLATNPIVLCATALVALGIAINSVINEMNRANREQMSFMMSTNQLKGDLLMASKYAGMNAAELFKLEKAYNGNVVALKEAILASKVAGLTDKEAASLKKGLIKATGEHGSEIDKTNKKIEEYLKKLKETGTTLPEISKAIAEIPAQWDKWNSIITMFEAIKNAGSVTFSFIGEISKSTVLKLTNDIEWGKEWLKTKAAEATEYLKMAQEEISTIGLGLFNDFTARTLAGFMAWGEGHKSILKAMGESFSGFVKSAIAGIGQMMTSILGAAAKEIFAQKAAAIAHVIASVMKSIPFPLNLILVGGAIAAVVALFAGLHAFGKGGYVDRPTLAVVGDVPEWIIPESNLARAGAGEQINKGRASNAQQPVHIHVNNYIGGEKVQEFVIKVVQQGFNRKTFAVPARVIV